jgi:mutator protein MutT
MRDTTLCFLIRESNGKITEICLAMKKRGFGKGRWNGSGGKVEKGETIEQAVVREIHEEIGVRASGLSKIAEIEFVFPEKPDWNQYMHTYFAREWEGDPSESEEMRPRWFSVKNLPFDEMWPDDEYWVPKVLVGDIVRAAFEFNEDGSIISKKVRTVDSLKSKK